MNTNTREYKRKQLANIANAYAAACDWLNACPFDDGQPFNETANRPLEEWAEKMIELSRELGDESLEESILSAITEGEWGIHTEEGEFWRNVARIVEPA